MPSIFADLYYVYYYLWDYVLEENIFCLVSTWVWDYLKWIPKFNGVHLTFFPNYYYDSMEYFLLYTLTKILEFLYIWRVRKSPVE